MPARSTSTANRGSLLSSGSCCHAVLPRAPTREGADETADPRRRRRNGRGGVVSPAVPARSARRPLYDGVCPIGTRGAHLIEKARDATLILILSDINMPGMTGL